MEEGEGIEFVRCMEGGEEREAVVISLRISFALVCSDIGERQLSVGPTFIHAMQ